jgi:ATP-dependent protease HslVU (ClpYQ) peptidase subunit
VTTVAGIEHCGRVFLAADSGSFLPDDSVNTVRNSKVFARGSWVFGIAGNWRVWSILWRHLQEPKRPDRHRVDLAMLDLVDEIRKLLDGHGFEQSLDSENAAVHPWFVLAGVNGELWEIDTFFQAVRSTGRHAAIGDGAQWAIAALDALDIRDPKLKLKRALEITEKRSMCARRPWRFVNT